MTGIPVVYACDAANRPATVTGLEPTFTTHTIDAGYRITFVKLPNGVESDCSALSAILNRMGQVLEDASASCAMVYRPRLDEAT